MTTKNDLFSDTVGLVPVETKSMGKVHIRQVSGEDVDYVYNGEQSEFRHMARLIVVGICSEYGERVFSPDDFDQIMKQPAWKLRELSDAVAEKSGFLSDVKEDVLGNSETTTPNDSGTA